jgi:ATP-dependent DNA helicase Q4
LKPPLGLLLQVCIDEAHCIAEWGHNFRPAYFRLGHVLGRAMRPAAVLGLTATATKATQASVTESLGMGPGDVVRSCPLRDNLRLQVGGAGLVGGG